jgi:hypothetical protein
VLFLAGTPTTGVPAVPPNVSAGILGGAKPNPFHLRTTIEKLFRPLVAESPPLALSE